MMRLPAVVTTVCFLAGSLLAAPIVKDEPPYEGSRERVGVQGRSPRRRYFFDGDSLVKNFVMYKNKGALPGRLTRFREPVVHYQMVGRRTIKTDEKLPPVPTYHMQPGAEPVTWEIGSLPVGTYMLRVIGAIPEEDMVQPPKNLVIGLTINDGLNGKTHEYVLRQRGVSSLYCVAEFGFHADDDRQFTAKVRLLDDSETSLYCYNIEIHDILAGCAKKAGKESPAFFTLESRARAREAFAATDEGKKLIAETNKQYRSYSSRARARRDHALWHSVPPRNWQFVEKYFTKRDQFADALKLNTMGSHNSPAWYLRRVYGSEYGSGWDQAIELVHDPRNRTARHDYARNEIYTLHQMLDHDPLPHVGDAGWGVREGDAVKWPFARVVTTAWQSLIRQLEQVDRYHMAGNEDYARDAAFLLCRFAYDMPTFSLYHTTRAATARAPLPWKATRYYQWKLVNHRFAEIYDKLFPFIKGNQELATAIGRFVPWIETPQDVQRLLETHLVQYMTKNMEHGRYYYDNDSADIMLTLIAVQGDDEIIAPWMEHLWNRGVYFYPIGITPLPHALAMNTQRDGTSGIGSYFYTHSGGPALRTAKLLRQFSKREGDRFDLVRSPLGPKVLAGCTFTVESPIAGQHSLAIGDVGGPVQPYGKHTAPLENAAEGWQWTKDPAFAWLLVHRRGRGGQSDAAWAEIEAAAATVENPLLNQPSRVLGDWSGILETGVGHPDFRFHAAAAVRVGQGYGHNHADALDLRVWAHGLNMVTDYGQRGAYGKPTHKATQCHNLVQIDEDNQGGHSWVRNLAPMQGVQYLKAAAVPVNPGALGRQTVLVDVDPGVPSRAEDPEKDPDVVTPNAYVFDVLRSKGGSMHTFAFHGCADDLTFDINVRDRTIWPRDATPARAALEKTNPDARYMKDFRWTRPMYMGEAFRPNDADWSATCTEDVLEATWRLNRKAEEQILKGFGGVGGAPTEPRKFTRLHLFGARGLKVLHGIVIHKPDFAINPGVPHYAGRTIYVRKPADESVFCSVVEPYAGEPFVRGRRLLAVSPDGSGHLAPVAAEVRVGVRTGDRTVERIDIHYADGNPDRRRTVRGYGIQAQAEYAAVQMVGQGIMSAALTNGTYLKAGVLEIVPERAAYTATVVAVDVPKLEVTLDAGLPAKGLKGAFMEFGDDLRRTMYEVADTRVEGGKTVLTLRKSIERARFKFRGVNADKSLDVSIPRAAEAGLWVANADFSRVGRVVSADDRSVTVEPEITAADVEKQNGEMILFEIGVGAEARLATRVSVKWTGREYTVKTNVPARVKLPGGEWKDVAPE